MITTIIITAGFISGCIEKSPIVPKETSQQSQQQLLPELNSAAVPENIEQSEVVKVKRKVFRDLIYSSRSPSQTLDLYVPDGTGSYPLVIVIHGGGFMTGDKTDSSEINKVKALLNGGFAAASINYRLSDEAIFPAQIHDVKTAVRYLRTNARKFGLDTDHFGAWGSSAGGTLAALLGTTCGEPGLEGAKLGNMEQSSCIQAVVDWFGLVDILKMDEQFAGTNCPGGHNDPDSAESKWVGAPIQSVPKLVYKTNPMNYIDASDPPFFIQHGSSDCRVPLIQSKNLAEALSSSIGKENVYFTQIDGGVHGGKLFTSEANLKKVLDFFGKYLR